MRFPISSLALTAAVMASPMSQTQAHTTLDALHDRQRVLLIFASANDARVEQQWSDLVANQQEAMERDLVTVLLTQSRVNKHDGEHPPEAIFTSDEEQRLRTRFHVARNEFTVILIGKEGGEKLRSNQPIAWNELAATIDAMPMRRDEMRQSQ